MTGLDNIPSEGPALLVSNHLSFSDSIFLPLVVPRRMTSSPSPTTSPARAQGPAHRGVLQGRRPAARRPLRRAGLRGRPAHRPEGAGSGELLGIYPEGTRSPDGRLYKGKTGVARMALEAGVPVIPVAMIDTDKAQPHRHKLIPKR